MKERRWSKHTLLTILLIARHILFSSLLSVTPNCLLLCPDGEQELTYVVTLYVEATLNYQTNWNTAQACQQWQLNDTWKAIFLPRKPKSCKGIHSSTHNKHPITGMSTLPPTSKGTPLSVNLLNCPASGTFVPRGPALPCCFTVSCWGCAESLPYCAGVHTVEVHRQIQAILSYSTY